MTATVKALVLAAAAAAGLVVGTGQGLAAEASWPELTPEGVYPSVVNTTQAFVTQADAEFYDLSKRAHRVLTPWPGNEIRCSWFRLGFMGCWQLDDTGTPHKMTLALGGQGTDLELWAVADRLPGWLPIKQNSSTEMTLTGIVDQALHPTSDLSSTLSGSIDSHREPVGFTPSVLSSQAIYGAYRTPLSTDMLQDYLNNSVGARPPR